MSVLANKTILVVGDENSLLFTLEGSLDAHGVKMMKTVCDKVTKEFINQHRVELVIINYLKHKSECAKTLESIRDPLLEKAIPVFALINDEADDIQHVLTLGVTDYITPNEEAPAIIAKIKAVFGQGDIFAGGVAIDISPIEASLSSTGIRVFVVEDDPLLRNLLSVKMNKSSFPCEFSNDGIDVVPVMRHFKPDVIILDLMLPGRSGFEVLAEVKADQELNSVPVIIFSNRDSQEDRDRAKQLGANAFYVKAMTDLSELVENIESLAV